MIVYASQTLSASAWPKPMETGYQALPARGDVPPGARRPGITQADRLFASAVVAIPRQWRYGAVTWMAQACATSRQTVYDIAASTQRHPEVMPAPAQARSATGAIRHASAVTVTAVARAALTLLFPGGVTLRPMTGCLDALLGETEGDFRRSKAHDRVPSRIDIGRELGDGRGQRDLARRFDVEHIPGANGGFVALLRLDQRLKPKDDLPLILVPVHIPDRPGEAVLAVAELRFDRSRHRCDGDRVGEQRDRHVRAGRRSRARMGEHLGDNTPDVVSADGPDRLADRTADHRDRASRQRS